MARRDGAHARNEVTDVCSTPYSEKHGIRITTMDQSALSRGSLTLLCRRFVVARHPRWNLLPVAVVNDRILILTFISDRAARICMYSIISIVRCRTNQDQLAKQLILPAVQSLCRGQKEPRRNTPHGTPHASRRLLAICQSRRM